MYYEKRVWKPIRKGATPALDGYSLIAPYVKDISTWASILSASIATVGGVDRRS
jgi:hypothetical protein